MRRSVRLALMLGGVLAASALFAPAAEAQWRPGRVRVFVGAHVGYPFYSPFYDPFFYRGFYGWGPGYWRGDYGPQWRGTRVSRDAVVIRTDVSPKDAHVYVDGYFRGSARDFDDRFTRLVVEPGEHEIVLFMEGYRTTRRTVDLRGGTVYWLREKLVRLSEGQRSDPPPPARAEAEPQEPERAEPLPGRPSPDQPRRPIARPPDDEPIERERPTERERPGGLERPEVERPETARPDVDRPGVAARGFGALAIRVQPAGAEVVIDGERWEGIDGRPLIVQLSEGRHQVEVRMEGYETFTTEVRVREGEKVPLNVSLPARR